MASRSNLEQPPSPAVPNGLPSEADESSSLPRRTLWLLPGFAVLGALAAWLLVERFHGIITMPEEIAALQSQVMGNQDVARRVEEARQTARDRNTVLAIGLLGVSIAGALGFGEGLARKSVRAALAAGGLGIALGALFGGLGGLLDIILGPRLSRIHSLDPMHRTVILHAIAFVLVGLAAGAAAGLSSRRVAIIRRRSIAGALGGVLAALLYSPTAALLFRMENSDLPVPNGSWNRLYWAALASVLMALAVLCASAVRRKPTRTEAT